MNTPFSSTPGYAFDLAGLMLAAVCMLALGWIGYIGVDDLTYAIAAYDWATIGPVIGDNHWALRHPFVILISLSFSLFGVSDLSLALPSILCYLLIVGFSYWFVRSVFDRSAALITAALLATAPQFANAASVANPEVVELCFILASLGLFLVASKEKPGPVLIVAGLAIGLGWLVRETAASLLLLYGVCFVAGYRYRRSQYLYLAAGFIAIVGFQMLLLWIFTGNPLYRIEMDFAHGECTPSNAAFLVRVADWHSVLAPWVVLGDDGNQALLLAVALAAVTLLYSTQTTERRKLLVVLIAFALVHFILVGYVFELRLSRYYKATTFVAVVLVSLGTAWLFRRQYRLPALLIVLSLVASNVLVTALRSGDRVFAARALAEYLETEPGEVYTDYTTRKAATFFLLDTPALTSRIRTGPPPPNARYLYDPHRHTGSALRGKTTLSEDLLTQEWQEILRISQEDSVVDRLLGLSMLDSILPQTAIAWRRARRGSAVVYRVPADADHAKISALFADEPSIPARCEPWRKIR